MGGASRFILLLGTPFSFLHSRPSLLRLTQRLSSSSSHHHLTFSPSSPPQFLLPLKSSQQFHTQTSSIREDYAGETKGYSPGIPQYGLPPWPEWSKLVDTITAGGYLVRRRNDDEDAFLVNEDLSENFVRAATSCLVFARDQPNLLGSLSRRDIEVVVNNGTPFLFRSSLDTARRMRSFLESNVLEPESRACTVDLMKYILSYASNPAVSSEGNNVYNMELVESSVRNLISQLAEASYRVREPDVSSSIEYPFTDSHYGQSQRPVGPKLEMKRGDWICARCSFMNFARNTKCLECEESRPKRQLTGGEWECPQCDFFNYGRNLVCLRCDCKRPGEASFGGTSNSRPSLVYKSGDFEDSANVDSRLAVNEEKAQRWFSKVSQLDNASDLSKAADDEDFPEIMPLRKGVNRFVVSTRKTPLERRLANSQYRRDSGDNGPSEGNHIQPGGANGNSDKSVNRSLDEILGRSTAISDADNKSSSPRLSSAPPQYGQSKTSSSTYAPFVPLPADMFAKKPQNSKVESSDNIVIESTVSSDASGYPDRVSQNSESGRSRDNASPTGGQDKEKEQAEKSERWFKKVAELHDVTDLASAISDEDFPEIMPVRKGENRFVISKKKDRSLTSPMYKRRMALEQSENTNFVPFVPFPPDYFSKKDKPQPDAADSSVKPAVGSSSISRVSEELPKKSDIARPGVSDMDRSQRMESQQTSSIDTISQNVTLNSSYSVNSGRDGWNTGYVRGENTTDVRNVTANVREGSPQSPETPNSQSNWTGKSLEGSAVKEIDPLDMSEEAKAERWFRRVAQIKDISELSQIPDEDFPSIMPMRKGVNRFVVSKRKTPLERRLTSPQYRRNLPVVSSDPLKKEGGGD